MELCWKHADLAARGNRAYACNAHCEDTRRYCMCNINIQLLYTYKYQTTPPLAKVANAISPDPQTGPGLLKGVGGIVMMTAGGGEGRGGRVG